MTESYELKNESHKKQNRNATYYRPNWFTFNRLFKQKY